MSRGSTPSSTPLRDQLGLNEDPDAVYKTKEIGRALKDGLSSLPSAKNDYQIMAPEMPTDDAEGHMEIEEDAADVAARNAARVKASERAAMKERSGSLKRKLPRPLVVDETNIVSSSSGKASDPAFLLEKEMYEMMEDDGVRFPVRTANGSNQADDPKYVIKSKSSLPYYNPDELSAASSLLKEELVNLLLDKGIAKEDDAELWEDSVNELVFVPSKSEFCLKSKCSEEDLKGSYSGTFEELRAQMGKEAKKANKMEKKLKTLTAGYEARAKQLLEEINVFHAEQETKSQELACFMNLEAQERFALPLRTASLKEEVDTAKKRESQLQYDFKSKMDELQALRAGA